MLKRILILIKRILINEENPDALGLQYVKSVTDRIGRMLGETPGEAYAEDSAVFTIGEGH